MLEENLYHVARTIVYLWNSRALYLQKTADVAVADKSRTITAITVVNRRKAKKRRQQRKTGKQGRRGRRGRRNEEEAEERSSSKEQ